MKDLYSCQWLPDVENEAFYSRELILNCPDYADCQVHRPAQ
jgi:hypothetical protein